MRSLFGMCAVCACMPLGGCRPSTSTPTAGAASSSSSAAVNEAVEASAAPPVQTDAGNLAQIQQAARGEASPSDALVWEVNEWPDRPGKLVALSYARAASAAAPAAELKAQVALLERREGSATLLARGSPPLTRTSCEDTAGAGIAAQTPIELHLDLARYDLSESERAIGLRQRCRSVFPAGEGDETRLYLLRVRDRGLDEVFDEVVAASAIQRGPNDAIDVRASVVVQAAKTLGVFDLLVEKTTTVSPLMTDPRRRKEARRASTRFAWNGERFVAGR